MQPTFRTSSPMASLVWMVIFGLVFIGASVGLYLGNHIPSSWIKETGKITSYTYDSGGPHSGPTYCPVVTYDVKSISYSATATSCGGGIPTVGDPAQIAYNPSNPAQGKVVGGIGDIFFIGLSGLIGLALIVFAPIAYKRSKNAPAIPAGSVFTSQWPHVPNPVEQVDQAIAAGQGQPQATPGTSTAPPVMPTQNLSQAPSSPPPSDQSTPPTNAAV